MMQDGGKDKNRLPTENSYCDSPCLKIKFLKKISQRVSSFMSAAHHLKSVKGHRKTVKSFSAVRELLIKLFNTSAGQVMIRPGLGL